MSKRIMNIGSPPADRLGSPELTTPGADAGEAVDATGRKQALTSLFAEAVIPPA